MRINSMKRLDFAFDEIAELMGCDEQCERCCVFPEVGERMHKCPINDFRDKVEDVIERREQ